MDINTLNQILGLLVIAAGLALVFLIGGSIADRLDRIGRTEE